MSPKPPPPRALTVELRLQKPDLDVRAQFRVLPSSICAIVGRSGAGKSALLLATAGLMPALGGRIALGNDAVYDSAARINRPPNERKLAWLDAHTQLFPHLNVRHNLLYSQGWWRRHRPHTRAQYVIQWMDIGSLLNRQPEALTVAERVRVALGRALISKPHALLLDDPLGAVPPGEQEALVELLADVPRRFKLPVVLVSPRMSEVIRLADEVVILHEGRMAGAGPTTHILSDVSLSTFLEGVHAGSVLEGTVKRHDIEWLLSEVDVSGQRVSVPAMLHAVGSHVRLKVRARDINLHREPPQDTSCSNLLRGRISQIMLAGEHGTYGAVGIELDQVMGAEGQPSAPPVPMWAMLTRKSIQQMGWAPGQSCVISFKAMATTVSASR